MFSTYCIIAEWLYFWGSFFQNVLGDITWRLGAEEGRGKSIQNLDASLNFTAWLIFSSNMREQTDNLQQGCYAPKKLHQWKGKKNQTPESKPFNLKLSDPDRQLSLLESLIDGHCAVMLSETLK